MVTNVLFLLFMVSFSAAKKDLFPELKELNDGIFPSVKQFLNLDCTSNSHHCRTAVWSGCMKQFTLGGVEGEDTPPDLIFPQDVRGRPQFVGDTSMFYELDGIIYSKVKDGDVSWLERVKALWFDINMDGSVRLVSPFRIKEGKVFVAKLLGMSDNVSLVRRLLSFDEENGKISLGALAKHIPKLRFIRDTASQDPIAFEDSSYSNVFYTNLGNFYPVVEEQFIRNGSYDPITDMPYELYPKPTVSKPYSRIIVQRPGYAYEVLWQRGDKIKRNKRSADDGMDSTSEEKISADNDVNEFLLILHILSVNQYTGGDSKEIELALY